jgi:hypothetical protein|tara:strand:+ start:2014 stop:2298 length:285 start_codon:yes stop_codon:yes gene_type:complete
MSKIKIHEDVFDRLIEEIRCCDDDQDLLIEIFNEQGSMLIYDNGRLLILHDGYQFQIRQEQLVDYQQRILFQVLMEYVERIVDNIISEAYHNVG